MATVYEYKGVSYELPDGLTNEQALAKIKSYVGETAQKPVETAPPVAAAQQNEPVSLTSRMFGLSSPLFRTVKGAVIDPALAVNQMLANTGLFGQTIKEGATRNVRDLERAVTEERAAVGSTGFDPYQLLGGVISPVNRLLGVTGSTAAPARGILETGKQAAATGAAMAALQPVNAPTQEFAERKLEQLATGAILGPVVQGGVSAIGYLSNRLSGLTASGRERFMRDELNKLAGTERDAVIKALQDASELVTGSRPTAAQAISNIPTAAQLMAAQQKLASKPELAGSFLQRIEEQQAARIRALRDISKTQVEREALEATRNAVTGEMREQSFALADIAKESLASIDQRIASEAGRLIRQTQELSGLPYPTANLGVQETTRQIARTSKETADALKKLQLSSLQNQGVFPVLAGDITSEIDKAIASTSSDLSKQVLAFAKEKIASKADSNGILSSRDLYDNVRKTLNQDIATFLQQGERFAQGGIPQQAASVAGNVKKLIDSSLNKSTGGLWGQYLNAFQTYSNKLNRMEIGEYLVNKLQTPLDKEAAASFAASVENAAQTIKSSTGIPRFEKLSDVLTTKEVATINNVLADLKRSSKADEFSRKISGLQVEAPDVAQNAPNLLNRWFTLGRSAIEALQRGNSVEYNQKMAELMLDPRAMASFMTEAVPKKRMPEFVSSAVKAMDLPTRNAFLQIFAIQPAARQAGEATPQMQ